MNMQTGLIYCRESTMVLRRRQKGVDTTGGMAVQPAVVVQQEVATTRTRSRRRRRITLLGLVPQWSSGQRRLLSMEGKAIMGARGVLGEVAGAGLGVSTVATLLLGGRG
jgi:hypothetical protein